MASKQFKTRIQWRRDTSVNWSANDPVLLNGEIAIVDTASGETRFKIGDGTKQFSKLPFQDEAIRALISDRVEKVDGMGLSSNDFTDTEKSKLAGIATGANKYTHPTSAGNKHIPAGGSANQILRWSADGTAVWGADNNTTYSNFVKSGSGAKSGLVPAPSTTAGTTKYLREDGTWTAPPNTTYSTATASANGIMSASDKTKLDGIATGANEYTLPVAGAALGGVKSGTDISVDSFGNVTVVNDSHTHSNSTITSLDASKLTGTVPTSVLPSFVDDVLEYPAKAQFPATGEAGKIYIDTATNLSYRWSGTTYVEISPSIALGTTSATAFRGDHGNTAYTHASAKGSAFASGLYKITTNAQGHVTTATAVTKADITALGIPASDTNTHYASKNVVAGSATATSNTSSALTNGNVYLISVENNAVTSAHKISGYDATTVTTDANGNIIISSTNTTYNTASTSSAGLMSAADKTKLDGIATGANKITVDTAMSSSSTNPVQNKVVNSAIAAKQTAKKTASNVSVASSAWAASTTYADYPFQATVAVSGGTASMIPEVVFDLSEAASGNFAPVAQSASGGVIIYAKEKPAATITIPTVIMWP